MGDVSVLLVGISLDPFFQFDALNWRFRFASPSAVNLLLPVQGGGDDVLRSGIGKSRATPVHFHVRQGFAGDWLNSRACA